MKTWRFHFIFAACFGVGAMLLYWILFSYYPPNAPGVLRAIQTAFAWLQIVPLSIVDHMPMHNFLAPSEWERFRMLAVFYVWWCGVGFILSFLLSILSRKLRGRGDAAYTAPEPTPHSRRGLASEVSDLLESSVRGASAFGR